MAKKRRGKHEGSVSQRKDGRWEVRLDLGIDPKTGKRRRISRYAKTKREAMEKLRSMQNEHLGRAIIEPSRLTLEQFLQDWLAASDHESKTTARYVSAFKNHVYPHIGPLRLDRLQPSHLTQWQARLSEVGSRTRQLVVIGLKAALNYATEQGLIGPNPAERMPTPKHVAEEVRCWNEADLAKFLDAAKESRLSALFVLAAFSGARRVSWFLCCPRVWEAVDDRLQSVC